MSHQIIFNDYIFYNFRTIIGMKPKDPLIIIQCARTLMTLPSMVRDLKLGKQYLKDALEMAPNDSSVLHAIKKAIDIYNGMVKLYFSRYLPIYFDIMI